MMFRVLSSTGDKSINNFSDVAYKNIENYLNHGVIWKLFGFHVTPLPIKGVG